MTTSDHKPITDEQLSEWRRLVGQAQGEDDPRDTLGPPPWSADIAKPWEARHQHDVRLSCLKVEYCAVVEQAHEAMEAALPALIGEVERLRSVVRDILIAAKESPVTVDDFDAITGVYGVEISEETREQ